MAVPIASAAPGQRIGLALDEDAELASPVSTSAKTRAWNSGPSDRVNTHGSMNDHTTARICTSVAPHSR